METMAGTGMDTQVLVILGAAFGVMFATLTTLMFTSMRLHRERLARIEGHLGIELPSKTDPESNGDNSEAA